MTPSLNNCAQDHGEYQLYFTLNQARIAAQAQENERIAAQVEGEQRLVDLYGPKVALLLKAIESGKVQIMVIPQGEGVTVPVPSTVPE